MGIPHAIVTNQNDFAAALYREEWFYVFSGCGLYEEIKPLLKQPDTSFPGGKRPFLALMAEWETEAYIPDVRFVSIPVQSLSIANVLNGRADSRGYAENSGIIRNTFPAARLLVVDDLPTNLKVAEGLLAPYQATVDTCLSGVRAIEMAERNEYNLILMDHMMPEIDGVEAVAAIRKIEGYANTPIIALTANAIQGMKEYYLENGFYDYLSKPISPKSLDEALTRWLAAPELRTPLTVSLLNALFLRRLDKLNHYRVAFEINKSSGGLEIDTEYYKRFTSLLECFDTLPDSLQADRAMLIEAGRQEDSRKICETLSAFCESITALYQKEMNNDETESEIVDRILQRLKKALEDGETNTAGRIVTELGAKNLNPAERELYFTLYDLLMEDNTTKAIEVIEAATATFEAITGRSINNEYKK
jgi:CheY-like chemotaxis protein